MEKNLKFWEQFRAVPTEARKTIKGGKLSGMTDINPVWRLQQLTAAFGPVGFGWNVREVERWTDECADEVAAFVKVELTICVGGQWSQPIEGTGGSKLCGKGRGEGINDEAWKMATTDAISVACKSLGMAADIYFEKGAYLGTKYESQEPVTSSPRGGAARTSPKPDNSQLTDEQYWQMVSKYADGQKTKTGGDYRSTWIVNYNPTDEQIAKFDHDVENVRAAAGR